MRVRREFVKAVEAVRERGVAATEVTLLSERGATRESSRIFSVYNRSGWRREEAGDGDARVLATSFCTLIRKVQRQSGIGS